MDSNVLMDGWVCEQFLLHGSRDLTPAADELTQSAFERRRLFISVLSYVQLREHIEPAKRRELDEQMVNVQRIPLTDDIVISLTDIPAGSKITLRLRLEAATAYCKNFVFVTAQPEVACDGMLVVAARKPTVIATVRRG